MSELKNISIDGTGKTPKIEFNQERGDLILIGRSIPENASLVYEPLLEWINDYIKSPFHTTNLYLNLEYFNSATSIWFAKMVRALSKITGKDKVFIIHLYFDMQDYKNMDTDDLSDMVSTLVGNISDVKVSIGLKIHGINRERKTVKDTMIFI